MGWPKGGGATSTVFLTGFAQNANDRELENFCRFIPGFVAAVANMKDDVPKVWVRFESPEAAAAAIEYLEGAPHDLQDAEVQLRASIAKTDTNPPGQYVPRRNGVQCVVGKLDDLLGLNGGAKSGWGATPPRRDNWESENASWGAGSNKRPVVVPAADVGKDTLCLISTEEKGYTEEYLSDYFGSLEGYVTMKYTPGAMGGNKGGGGSAFIKFSSHALAKKASQGAKEAGIGVEWARTNLNVALLEKSGSLTSGGHTADAPAARAKGSHSLEISGPAGKRPRIDVPTGSEQDTLVVFALEEKGWTQDDFEKFFSAMDGYITFRIATGKGGGTNAFVKFESDAQCLSAIDNATGEGLECQVARTSLNVDIPSKGAAQVSQTGQWPTVGASNIARAATAERREPREPPGEEDGDTLCIMGVLEKGYTEEALVEFCLQLDGFYALRYSPHGKAGGMCFIKFTSAKEAADAQERAAEAGTVFEFARTSLKCAQATYTVS